MSISHTHTSSLREAPHFLSVSISAPEGAFDFILCRCVAFVYFACSLREQVLAPLLERCLGDGYFVISGDEQLARGDFRLLPLVEAPQILLHAV